MSTKIVDVSHPLCYLLGMTPQQCRAARGWLDMSQAELAGLAKVSLSTVRDFEKGRRAPIGNNLSAIRGALEAKGLVFLENGLRGPTDLESLTESDAPAI